jgi:hypothetical protein
MSQEAGQSQSFWQNLLRAAEAEPQSKTSVRGASGIVHSAVAIGFDESRRRLLVVSGEHDARTAAMAQIDIQTALKNIQVLVARPLALNFSAMAKNLVSLLGRDEITSDDIAKYQPNAEGAKESLAKLMSQTLGPLDFLGWIPLNVVAQWMQSIQQLANVNFSFVDSDYATKKRLIINLRRLAELDPVEHDNLFGICPVPLYAFSPGEVDLMNGDPNLDDVRELLHQHHLIQYFFPAPDELALGLVDRGAESLESVLDQVNLAPCIGHPYGPMALLEKGTKLTDLIDALGDRGLVVEGEMGLQVGPNGEEVRTSLKFKPQEGLLSKIIGRFSVKVNLKNFIGGG